MDAWMSHYFTSMYLLEHLRLDRDWTEAGMNRQLGGPES